MIQKLANNQLQVIDRISNQWQSTNRGKLRSETKLSLILVHGIAILLSESVKFLGLRFQSNHSWIQHIKIIKAKCYRAINILKILAHPSKGCNRKTLLPLYQSLIRSILDYGSPNYGLAPASQLSLLDPVQNTALRSPRVHFELVQESASVLK